MKRQSASESAPITPLLRVADYLGRPVRLLTVAEARAGFREALREAARRSVVLTSNGEPQAAIVSFETLGAMRGVLPRLFVSEMNADFERVQQRVAAQSGREGDCQGPPEPTGEAELESLVREARRQQAGASPSAKRKRRR
jgi:prevent-host-death family protein